MKRIADNRSGSCPSRLELAGYQAGEADGERAATLARHLEQCPACRREIQFLEQRRGEFLSAHPPGQLLAELDRRSEVRPRRLVLQLAAAGLAAGLAAVLLIWARPRGSAVRTKGGFSLQVYLLRQGRVTRVKSGALFLPGDRIQFTCSSPAGGYLFLVSVDASGRIFNYNHQGSSNSVRLAAGSDQVMEGSILLDDSHLAERVFAILSDHPLDFDQVRRAVERTWHRAATAEPDLESITRLDLPYSQDSFLLRKRAEKPPR